jgi:hypothetical protein
MTRPFHVDLVAFRRAVKAVLPSVSDEEERAHLNCVHFHAVDSALRVEGTNGHMFSQWAELPCEGDVDVSIPKAACAAFLRLLTSDLDGNRNLDLFVSNNVEIHVGEKARLHHVLAGTVPYKPVETDVGQWETLGTLAHPAKREVTGRIALASEYLTRLAKIFKDASETTEGCVLDFGSSKDVVLCTHPAIHGLTVGVMPMTLEPSE